MRVYADIKHVVTTLTDAVMAPAGGEGLLAAAGVASVLGAAAFYIGVTEASEVDRGDGGGAARQHRPARPCPVHMA